jgi:hypothetical protein
MSTIYGRWYCPSCQQRLMAALDASMARGIKALDEQPTASEPVWLDCTCGHPNDDHGIEGCCFPACGCARSGRVEQPRASAGDVERLADLLDRWERGEDGANETDAWQNRLARALLASDWLADVRREERERFADEVEDRLRQQHNGPPMPEDWHDGIKDARRIVREARGGAR